MNTNVSLIETLSRYFKDYRNGELNNEPARLICEYLEVDLDLEGENGFEHELKNWLEHADLQSIGVCGSMGVDVCTYVDGDRAEYGSGEGYTWTSAREILRLAEISDYTGDVAPVPDWYEDDWKGVAHGVAIERIEEMGNEEVKKLLSSQSIIGQRCDEGISYEVGFVEYLNPKKALIHLIDNVDVDRRARILRGVKH